MIVGAVGASGASRTRRMIGVVLAALTASATMAAVASPADAELASVATTTWGVSGLLTGTETDTINSPVFTMEQIGGVLYVGGRFTTVTNGIDDAAQVGLAAFDATTGVWLPEFSPVIDGAVYALQASPDGTRLFVGGDFTTVDGVASAGLAAVDPAAGTLDPTWSGRVGGYQVVRSFDIDGPWLYVGGGFTSISSAQGGRSAHRVARFDAATGSHDPNWRPVIRGGSVWGLEVSPEAGRVYLAGSFETANGEVASGGFVSIEVATGANTPDVAALQTNGTRAWTRYTYDVVAVNGRVYVAGSQYFLQVLNESDLSLETFHISKYRGDYQDLEVVGDRVYAGCHCRQDTRLASANGVIWPGTPPEGESNAVAFAESPNSWLAAFDTDTGLHIPEFRPDMNSDGSGIWAIHEDLQGCLWLGGAVTATGGTPQYSMTRICDLATIDTERPSVPGRPGVEAVGAGSVELRWLRSVDNFGVVGYRLYDAATNTILIDVPVPSASLTGLAPGALSIYARAYDSTGNESWRSGVTTVEVPSADTPPPDTRRPTVPGKPNPVDIGPESVELSWIPATDDVGVAGYRLYDAATNAVLIDTVVIDGQSPTATIDGLAPGPLSLYARAYDAAGNESWRSAISTMEISGP